MKTEDRAYHQYLQNKYLPGRSQYLKWVFYPRLFRTFATQETIIDLGCGTGAFLEYCATHGHPAIGVDSNGEMVRVCVQRGFRVLCDDISELSCLSGQSFKYAICDNVLEHLERPELGKVFRRVEQLLQPGGVFLCIVPGVKGFRADPTHKTYITASLLRDLCDPVSLSIKNSYYHPVNLRTLDRFLYLNMQVFEISKKPIE